MAQDNVRALASWQIAHNKKARGNPRAFSV
jgi:hypothetical protein